jgi:hypothetical protein
MHHPECSNLRGLRQEMQRILQPQFRFLKLVCVDEFDCFEKQSSRVFKVAHCAARLADRLSSDQISPTDRIWASNGRVPA